MTPLKRDGASGIDPEDLQIDTYTSGTRAVGRRAVRITHIPTGIVTQAEDQSLLRARERAILELRQRLGLGDQ